MNSGSSASAMTLATIPRILIELNMVSLLSGSGLGPG
jgi:hypothetical protein